MPHVTGCGTNSTLSHLKPKLLKRDILLRAAYSTDFISSACLGYAITWKIGETWKMSKNSTIFSESQKLFFIIWEISQTVNIVNTKLLLEKRNSKKL